MGKFGIDEAFDDEVASIFKASCDEAFWSSPFSIGKLPRFTFLGIGTVFTTSGQPPAQLLPKDVKTLQVLEVLVEHVRFSITTASGMVSSKCWYLLLLLMDQVLKKTLALEQGVIFIIRQIWKLSCRSFHTARSIHKHWCTGKPPWHASITPPLFHYALNTSYHYCQAVVRMFYPYLRTSTGSRCTNHIYAECKFLKRKRKRFLVSPTNKHKVLTWFWLKTKLNSTMQTSKGKQCPISSTGHSEVLSKDPLPVTQDSKHPSCSLSPPDLATLVPMDTVELTDHMIHKAIPSNYSSFFCTIVEGKMNPNQLEELLRAQWKNFKILSMQPKNGSVLQVWSASKEEMKKIWQGQPWVAAGHTVLFQSWEDFHSSGRFSFDKGVFWVHLLDLPTFLQDKTSINYILRNAGVCLDYDIPQGDNLQFQPTRVKLLLDLTKPFPIATKINTLEHWVFFGYEFLPSLCHACGRVGHIHKACTFGSKANSPYKKLIKRMRVTPSDILQVQAMVRTKEFAHKANQNTSAALMEVEERLKRTVVSHNPTTHSPELTQQFGKAKHPDITASDSNHLPRLNNYSPSSGHMLVNKSTQSPAGNTATPKLSTLQPSLQKMPHTPSFTTCGRDTIQQSPRTLNLFPGAVKDVAQPGIRFTKPTRWGPPISQTHMSQLGSSNSAFSQVRPIQAHNENPSPLTDSLGLSVVSKPSAPSFDQMCEQPTTLLKNKSVVSTLDCLDTQEDISFEDMDEQEIRNQFEKHIGANVTGKSVSEQNKIFWTQCLKQAANHKAKRQCVSLARAEPTRLDIINPTPTHCKGIVLRDSGEHDPQPLQAHKDSTTISNLNSQQSNSKGKSLFTIDPQFTGKEKVREMQTVISAKTTHISEASSYPSTDVFQLWHDMWRAQQGIPNIITRQEGGKNPLLPPK